MPDYAKKGGGTRMHDAVRIRALATGIGQTEASAHGTGSGRMNRVVAGMKPGQLVHDHALAELAQRREADMPQPYMDNAPGEDALARARRDAYPLLSEHHQTHEQAGTMREHSRDDQGEQERKPATGRGAHPSMQVTPAVSR